jgi:type 1 glutamine amidotransferase
VVWLSTTGDVLDTSQQQAFERYINAGGGYAGVHAAADTEYDWPWYGRLVGAYFKSHPQIQEATVQVTEHTHPSTNRLPDRWQRTDEWYNYRTNPRSRVTVLATLDESSYDAGPDAMGDHPIAWCHAQGKGRSWYTGGGHTSESYTDPLFRAHLVGGIRYAAGIAGGPRPEAASRPRAKAGKARGSPQRHGGAATRADDRAASAAPRSDPREATASGSWPAARLCGGP